ARAHQTLRAGRRRRRREGCPRAARPVVPLPPPLPRTAAAPDAPTGRSAHPPTHPLSRPHRSHDRRPDMTLPELDAALRKLRLSGMADVLEARLRQAQQTRQAPIDLVSALVGDELLRRQDRLLARRLQQARFRDAERTLDTFDFGFNRKM